MLHLRRSTKNQLGRHSNRFLPRFALLLLFSFTASTLAATPNTYTDRPSFEATLSTSIIDDYESPTYPTGFGIYSNADMTAFLGETEYETTGWDNFNFVTDSLSNQLYCSGCNGSFRLTFKNTSLTDGGVGVYGVGVDILQNGGNPPYFAFITFGDQTTTNFALPPGASFFGVTAPELIESIHFGLSDGGPTRDGSFALDNLTIGAPRAAPTAVPTLPQWALILLSVFLILIVFTNRERLI